MADEAGPAAAGAETSSSSTSNGSKRKSIEGDESMPGGSSSETTVRRNNRAQTGNDTANSDQNRRNKRSKVTVSSKKKKKKKTGDTTKETTALKATADKDQVIPVERQFQKCHLRMLQSLYETNDNDDDDSSEFSDGNVSSQVWEMVGRFIQERRRIEKIRWKAETAHAVFSEALLFAGPEPTDGAENVVFSSSTTMSTGTGKPSPSQETLYGSPLPTTAISPPQLPHGQSHYRHHRRHHHPHQHRILSSPGRPIQAAPGNNMAMSSAPMLFQLPRAPFAVLSTVLAKRSNAARSRAQQETLPYENLATTVNKRIETLHRIITNCQDKRAEDDRHELNERVKSTASSNDSNCMTYQDFGTSETIAGVLVEMQTRLKLWQRLANHLNKSITLRTT